MREITQKRIAELEQERNEWRTRHENSASQAKRLREWLDAAEAKLARVKKEILERDVYGDELDPDDLLQILNDKEGE